MVADMVFTVRVVNRFVQYVNVSVLPVRCPAVNTMLEPNGLACTCVPGSYFTDNGAFACAVRLAHSSLKLVTTDDQRERQLLFELTAFMQNLIVAVQMSCMSP